MMRSSDETNLHGPGRSCRAPVRSHLRTSEPFPLGLQRSASLCRALRAVVCPPQPVTAHAVAVVRAVNWRNQEEEW